MSDGSTSDDAEHLVLCGFCGSPVAHRVESDPTSQAGCVFCNNWANIDNVISIAKESVVSAAKKSRSHSSVYGRKFKAVEEPSDSDIIYLFITDYEV